MEGPVVSITEEAGLESSGPCSMFLQGFKPEMGAKGSALPS